MEKRFVDIESKLAHQEFLLEKLNALVLDQEKSLYQLQTKVSLLEKTVRELEGMENEIGGPNQKPPHY
jgi:SlyX protein